MPQADFEVGVQHWSHLEEKLAYDHQALREHVQSGELQLNVGQQEVYDAIHDVIEDTMAGFTPQVSIWKKNLFSIFFAFGIMISNNHFLFLQEHVFFIEGPGGTGKTFLYNLLLQRV